MKKHPFLSFIFLLPFLFASSLHSAKIPHQGRVLVEGKPFDGEGQFWFALVTQDGGFAWNHEGWGGVPTSPLTVSVRGGFYKVVLGDTSIAGMSTLPDQLLAANDDLELAIWFSDGVNGIARLGENQPLSKSTYSIVSDHLRNTQLMNALSERLDFLENENNQSISGMLNQMSSRIEEINAAQLISSLEIIDSNLSDIYQRIDSMEDNPPVSEFSPAALAKITALEQQLEKALNRIDTLETTQSSSGMDPRILAQLGYRYLPDANLTGLDLTSVVLEDANFSGADLEGAKLKNTNFRNADLSKANLRGTDLGNLELSGAKLSGADLRGASFYGTNFSKADFSGAKLSDQAQPADFNGSILDGNFTGYDFSNADFRGSNLKPSVIFEDANFTAANLRNFSFTDSSGNDFVNFKNAYFYDSNLSFGIFYESRGLPYWGFAFTISDFSFGVFNNADLSDADLTMANFSNAKIVQSNLSGADLTDANFSNTTLSMVNFRDAILNDIDFQETTMDRSSLESLSRASSLKEVNFSGLDLHDLNFSGIDLSGSNFSESNLSGVDFTGAKLDDTDFNETIINRSTIVSITKANSLTGFNFSGMDLRDLNFTGANLTGTSFVGSDLSDTNFSNANLTDVDFNGSVIDASAMETIFEANSLNGVNFTGQDLRGITDPMFLDYRGSTWKGANLSGIDLSKMNDTSEDTYDDLGELRGEGSAIDARWLTETNLGGSYQFPVAGSYFFNVVDFTEVNLSEVNFSNLDMAGIILDGADLQDANLSGVNLYKLSLEYRPTVGGSYTKVYHYPSFVGANLQGADLSGTYLEANMTGANLSGANLSGATFSGVDLTDANLTDATLPSFMDIVTFSNTIMPDGTVRSD